MLAPVLLVVLATSATPVPGPVPALVPEEEYVQEVRIEAEDPERLERFVSLVPGRPLDAEAVRRTVELMHATGEFEDVRVRIEREEDEEGLTVVIQPVPAPLLVDVRVEGDRVLSAATVRRVTRLRRGEPLWEDRLDRAGRDAALALVARGYLEAFVEPPQAVPVTGGANAVFRVRSGPRVRVGSLSVAGPEAVQRLSLGDLVRPRQGGIYRRDQAEKAAAAMRRRLARHDFWQATVDLDAAP